MGGTEFFLKSCVKWSRGKNFSDEGLCQVIIKIVWRILSSDEENPFCL